mgnify:CR=1 FL=1
MTEDQFFDEDEMHKFLDEEDRRAAAPSSGLDLFQDIREQSPKERKKERKGERERVREREREEKKKSKEKEKEKREVFNCSVQQLQ